MKKAENAGEGGCLQRDSTECKEYAGAQSAVRPEAGETEVREPRLLERILFRDNMNRAYKRVKANKGAPGVDGMTVEEALPWLKEHGKESDMGTDLLRRELWIQARTKRTGRNPQNQRICIRRL